MRESRFQPISLAALIFFIFLGVVVLADRDGKNVSASSAQSQSLLQTELPTPEPPDQDQSDPAAIRAPYDHYTITQGPHGQSYGQLAIDLTGGNGAAVLSPISGQVTGLYIDELGNTTLIIDNAVWQVTLLHGNYIVQPGDQVVIGQVVGYESNNGNTVDWRGRSCRGRDCGYHTHLNIYDKRIGSNVNPLEVLSP